MTLTKLYGAAKPQNSSSKVENSKVENDMKFEDFVPSETSQATKGCTYPGCEARIPQTSEFNLCDKCRTLAARNSVALLLDPISPQVLQRAADVQQTLLTNMSGEEILRYAQRVEAHYLEIQKVIKLHKLSTDTKRPVKSLSESIEEAREIENSRSIRAKQNQKREKKNKSRSEKLQELLGVDKKQAERIMGEKFDL